MLSEIVNFIVSTIGHMGYVGICILMFLESSFFPFPSEVVIPPAGYLASKGEMNLYWVIFCGIFGSLLGAIFNYYLAYFLGRPFFSKYGKYFFVSETSLSKAENFFKEHGHISTFIGRLLPGIRQYISLPAGIAKMNLTLFCVFTSLGAGIWVVVLTLVGYFFGMDMEVVREKVHLISIVLFVFVVFITVIYIYFKKRGRREK